ncbi:phosphodiester glycosidase family protein [Nocardioides bruguierae]|uniref:phosphodiester glycosidase family protein n=1 Tax=Nocardioides bruguierae TaxID=2945102 RepID=UPI00202163F6|nr:phosphodiester glycosidase family protein [Nocardioides bruguierae]MCL8025076.1 phosphodiester glycosidase family protein [Nocardioides bruguierae]
MIPRRPLAGLVALVTAGALAAPLGSALAADGSERGTSAERERTGRLVLDRDAVSSTGESGRAVADDDGSSVVLGGATGGRVATRTGSVTEVRPGVSFTRLSATSSRGTTRATLLTVSLRQRGVGLDVEDGSSITGLSRVRTMLGEQRRFVAAVNGDFFDIHGTNAPLGTALSPSRGLLNARARDWNQTFMLTSRGRPVFEQAQLYGRVGGVPGGQLTNVNSATVLPGGIGVYTRHWGTYSPGRAVVEGRRQGVRMVIVRKGRVAANRAKVVGGKRGWGMVLVGRGAGAKALATLRKGERVKVRKGLVGQPQLALTGSRIIIDDGVGRELDDTETAPRTVIGIDRDTKELLLLAVDGRSSRSRGFTLAELVGVMQQLGADEALNLDGGGSTTMAVRRQGRLRLVNTPSDGAERSVANSLVVTYDKPGRG